MDKQNFEAEERFPLSTQALSFMQEMILVSSKLALIGGPRYILSGCESRGNQVNSGWIVLDGEILPLEGGVVSGTITVVDTVVPVVADGITYEQARVVRKAIFATGRTENYYPWADFKPLPTNKQLEAVKATVKYVDEQINKVKPDVVPTGLIAMWSGREADIPKGWCLCDGRTLADRTKVPDLRGRFIVGYNPASGSGYTAIKAGSKSASQYNVTLTTNELPSHDHLFNDYFFAETQWNNHNSDGFDKINSKVVGSNSTDNDNNCLYYKTHYTQKSGAGKPFDIRPPYYVLAFIMKIKS